ncbi:MAG: cytidylate kinase-like family protein [Clostridiales bacterium]|nr:cytidylate kinase-like family protein [Clostridiales bacterium]
MNRIITISRQFGSGGRTIGKEVAKKLGIPCYDSELILKIAEKSGLSKEYIENYGEHAPSASWLSNIVGRDYNGRSVRDDLWLVQHEIITELAQKESCVIVGRCADHILKNTANCLTVFVHASPEKRAKRIVEIYGESDEKPEKRLIDKDKRRKSYYQFYTDSTWGDATKYDISLDSGKFGIDKCVSIIAQLY